MFNGQIIIIKEGQLITGRKKLAEATGIADTTIERILNHFEKTGRQIEQQKTNKYRLITIINWPKYQSENSKTDNKWTTDGQQTDTFKKYKKNKNNTSTEPQAALVAKAISFFEEINPSVKKLYGMPPQRGATERLIEIHGLERVRKAVGYIAANRDNRYCPSITTPAQLEDKWAQLEDFARKQKSRIKKVIL